MIKGVLFDMDGVLVDSEEYICRAAIEMFKEIGLNTNPGDFEEFIGTGENRYIGGVAEKYNKQININQAKGRTYQIYGNIVQGKLKALPGVHEFIKKAQNKNIKLAVATSADEIKMKINLDEIGLSASSFDATVNGLEVEHKKPAPDIFLLAAKKIGLPPDNCLVVEDAVSGVKAAKKAGSRCLALKTSFDGDDLIKADWICNTLADAPDECLNW